MLMEIRTQSQLLPKLALSTNSLETSLQHALAQRGSSSRYDTGTLHQRVRKQIRTLLVDGCNNEQKLALNFLRNIPINPESIRLQTQSSSTHVANPMVPSIFYLSASESRWKHSRGQECHGSWSLRTRRTLPVCKISRNLYRPKSLRVYSRLLIHPFPIGVLSVSVTEKTTTRSSAKKDNDD